MSRARFVYREDESRDCESENGVTYDQENYDPQESFYNTSEFFEEDQGQAPEENGTEATIRANLARFGIYNPERGARGSINAINAITSDCAEPATRDCPTSRSHNDNDASCLSQSYTGDPGQDNTRDRHQDPPERPRLRPTRSTARQGTGAKRMKSVIEQGTGAAPRTDRTTCFAPPLKAPATRRPPERRKDQAATRRIAIPIQARTHPSLPLILAPRDTTSGKGKPRHKYLESRM